MAELDPLIRVRKHDVEQKQKMLAELFRNAEALKDRRDTLETQLAIESEKIKDLDIEMVGFFAPYADSVHTQIEGIDEDRKKLEVCINMAQDDMRGAYAELKKIEIISERRRVEALAELDKKESDELDEIAINMFIRKNEDD
ncbi:MAG: hypothetical protein COA45_07990 [Zetaproteobacteria bacterium]|nr:MAG: hypothetical protein COA45_07990 [Zetaproteobacteria bacterium]